MLRLTLLLLVFSFAHVPNSAQDYEDYDDYENSVSAFFAPNCVPRIVGYAASWAPSFSLEQARRLSHVIYSFFTMDANGKLLSLQVRSPLDVRRER